MGKPNVNTPKLSVQDRIEAAANRHGGDIDAELDAFSLGGYKSNFKPRQYFKAYQISAPIARRLREFYAPHLAELQEALSGVDPELRKAYPCGKRELTRYVEFVEAILAACDGVVEEAKVTRKPRARKVKPPEVLVANLKHLSEVSELGIKSVDTTGLIRAQEAWFYDHAKRKLVWFKAADRDGLSVKGTTILNYDEKTSGAKPVRKPETLFKDLLIGCRGLLRAWNDIRGKTTTITGRTNDNMILLAVG